MISFIVPAHNEERMLPYCLRALHCAASQCRLDYEIVVVDDASTDATSQVALQQGARVIPVQHRHIAATRNAGAKVAQGEVLIFVDADTQISPHLLQAALKALEQGAIGGGCAVKLQGCPRWSERMVVQLLNFAFRLTHIAPGCFIYCTRQAFDAVGGFDETVYAAEDVLLSKALARHGRFVILKACAETSDRKMRTHGVAEHARLFWRFARRGWGILKDKDDLGLWYGDRRNP